jgi:hypothetical protein
MRLLKEDGLVKLEKTLVWLLAVFLTELTWIACSTSTLLSFLICDENTKIEVWRCNGTSAGLGYWKVGVGWPPRAVNM